MCLLILYGCNFQSANYLQNTIPNYEYIIDVSSVTQNAPTLYNIMAIQATHFSNKN